MSRRVSVSAAEARRIALAAQGFDRPRPARPNDIRHFRRVLADIAVLQLDFVNVLLPAHFLMIWSRLGSYDRPRFERWLYGSGEYTEQWAHEASIVSVEDWPLLAHRRDAFERWKGSPLLKLKNRSAYLTDILEQIRTSGAVTSHDVPPVCAPKHKTKAGDWHRPLPRFALEDHFGRGKLAVRHRLANFQRVYDLPERLIPAAVRRRVVAAPDAQRELLRKASRALGIATARDLVDYYRMSPNDARPRIAELVEEGALQTVAVEGWENSGFLAEGARAPRRIRGASLLSPFDPVVWFRPRAERLFDFEYRIEIYVPAPKRRWGYYVLPFREGDRITARVDLKADRKASRLVVQRAHREACAEPGKTAERLREELSALANWLGLAEVRVERASAFEKALARKK